jgi:hypothetical protein
VLAERGRIDRAQVARLAIGWEEVERRLEPFTLSRAARLSGVPADTIERLALEFADAPTAAAYSRVGVCNNTSGTLATFATDLLNLAAGRLGAAGGSLFASPAFDVAGFTRLAGIDGHDRWRSRVRGLPETLGDLPAAVLAEEMETPRPGSGAGARDLCRQSGAVDPERAAAGGRDGNARVHRVHRPLRERDDASCRRHLAARPRA